MSFIIIQDIDGDQISINAVTNALLVELSASGGVSIGDVDIARQTGTATATIGAAASLSDEVDLAGFPLVGVIMPAAWTAANLTFQVASASGGTFVDLYDDAGNEVEVNAAASRGLAGGQWLEKLAPWRFVKVRSGTTGTPVAQGAERVITLALKG